MVPAAAVEAAAEVATVGPEETAHSVNTCDTERRSLHTRGCVQAISRRYKLCQQTEPIKDGDTILPALMTKDADCAIVPVLSRTFKPMFVSM